VLLSQSLPNTSSRQPVIQPHYRRTSLKNGEQAKLLMIDECPKDQVPRV